jgi:hypothetical protein
MTHEEKTWKTDEYGISRWHCQGWEITIRSGQPGFDIEGPENIEVWCGDLGLSALGETSGQGYAGFQAVTAEIPWAVLKEIIGCQGGLG